ncbi:MAG TPA: UDP-4-amino-4,6-dideoxy-N-acetyl-beta-L-altrosamine transaminase [Victivallales bacterium]|nr:UDP-4-amino-4,6-dideoxy-N-acetyl-beta-L-altrosamine transaminase [Victivallales bacterium]HRU01406.1 UDP-4-amino-4,6-dideoxy-N-acetyl-beta-L-altrosamine transaminase [Victivallales bacterium]
MIPYGKQSIDIDDIQSVIDVLKSNFITTGPKIAEFEKVICDFTDAKFAVAVSSGTAALHSAIFATGINEGDEVIVPTMTFAATANAILYQRGKPVFVDVLPENLLINPDEVRKKITSKTKAIIAVDYAGHPCDYSELRKICNEYGLKLIADACHSLGAMYTGRKVGTLADITCFSFHPVKHITTGEGGMALTDNKEYADKMRVFRNHGITTDYRQREEKGAWFYEMEHLGFNYRITDFQCALGISQVKKLPLWIKRRQEIALYYDCAFKDNSSIVPLRKLLNVFHAYHLYVVKLTNSDRDEVFAKMRKSGIGVNVHYIPVHLHPYYRKQLRTSEGLCPVAEQAYKQIISLPIFPGLENGDLDLVIKTLQQEL